MSNGKASSSNKRFSRATSAPAGWFSSFTVSPIEGAIIDKNARIGADVVIRPFPLGTDIITDNWTVQDGIVVVPKDTVLPPGTCIEIEKA